MNVPMNTPSAAMNSHGEPCSNRMIPQLMKKVNSRKTRMAAKNFIAANYSFFVFPRNSGSCQNSFALPSSVA